MRKIAFSPPDIGEEEIAEVVSVLRSGWITTGPRTKQLENDLAAYTGTAKSAVLNSGTAAMELTLRLFGIGPGDEVITTAYTYSASASVIVHVGATPILVDTAKDSYEMDYEALEAAITPKTRAVIPVDIGGVMADYSTVRRIAEEKKNIFQPQNDTQASLGRILILADAAHSIGAQRDDISSGLYGDFTAFSTHAVKNVTTAEGGAVTWRSGIIDMSDEEIYRQFMLLSLHGQNKDALQKSGAGSWEYDILGTYYKNNMTDIHAAIGVVQLKRYPELLERRKEICRMYDEILNPKGIKTLQHSGESFESSRHLYLTRIPGIKEEERNRIIESLGEMGVTANVHYKPLPMLTAYKNLGFKIEDYPCAYSQYENGISLPLHTLLSDEDVQYTAQSLLRAGRDL